MKALAYLLLFILACSSEFAVAKPKDRRPPPRPAPPPAHHVPVPVPAPVVPSHWHGGHWHHGPHDGRYGWWWVVGSLWYFYDYPIWPYWYERERVIVVEQEAPPVGPPPAYWYWCESPKGYYPYVAQCSVEWKPVLAAAPPPPPEPKKP